MSSICDSCNSKSCEDCEHKKSRFEQGNSGSNVKKVIAVMSGKGGVGKSLTTALLASETAKLGYKVAVMDADITGPSIPKLFGLSDMATSDGKNIYPVLTKGGIKVLSINLMLEDPTQPVVWPSGLVIHDRWLCDGHVEIVRDILEVVLVGFPGHIVLVQVIASGTGESTDAGIDDRKFPVILVVDLGGTREQDRSAEHGADLDLVLVCQPSEIFLEGEQFVRTVPLVGIAGVVVVLGEGTLLELCI